MDTSTMLYRIECLLKEKKMSKGEFYAMVPVSSSAVAQWRRGRVPKIENILRMAEILKVDPSYLLCEDTKKESAPTSESELDGALVKLLCSLTPTELAQVQGFAAALISARKA